MFSCACLKNQAVHIIDTRRNNKVSVSLCELGVSSEMQRYQIQLSHSVKDRITNTTVAQPFQTLHDALSND